MLSPVPEVSRRLGAHRHGLMGHEDIKSTVVYTEVTDAALSAAVLRLPWKL